MPVVSARFLPETRFFIVRLSLGSVACCRHTANVLSPAPLGSPSNRSQVDRTGSVPTSTTHRHHQWPDSGIPQPQSAREGPSPNVTPAKRAHKQARGNLASLPPLPSPPRSQTRKHQSPHLSPRGGVFKKTIELQTQIPIISSYIHMNMSTWPGSGDWQNQPFFDQPHTNAPTISAYQRESAVHSHSIPIAARDIGRTAPPLTNSCPASPFEVTLCTTPGGTRERTLLTVRGNQTRLLFVRIAKIAKTVRSAPSFACDIGKTNLPLTNTRLATH